MNEMKRIIVSMQQSLIILICLLVVSMIFDSKSLAIGSGITLLAL